MAKTNQAHDQTMEEILASIRRMISDDVKREGADATDGAPVKLGSGGNVSRLFNGDQGPAVNGSGAEQRSDDDNVVELAIARAIEEARAEFAAETRVLAPEPPKSVEGDVAAALEAANDAAPTAPEPGADGRDQPLLSPQTDIAVAGAFNRLAATMLSRSVRTIDELVEDLLRPLLRNWLDSNLPQLVERLVREEIERVSRGRR